MEKVALNNVQLDYLAKADPKLSQVFYGTVACDHLPSLVNQEGPTAYIVNTDPHDEPRKHWIALWTQDNVCEILDSYAMPLEVYKTTEPLTEWLNRHYKYQVASRKTLQLVFSQSCGDYVLMFLVLKARGRSMQDFLSLFPGKDYVSNDRKVGRWLRRRIADEVAWKSACDCQPQQTTYRFGIRHLL